MGKITIKHYLNKNIEYLDKTTNENVHPVYLQITAKRKTTQIRSLTDYLMNESDFAKYELFKTPKFDSEIKKITKEFLDEVKFELLKDELLTVLEILEYCINSKNIQFGKLRQIIEFYSKSIIFEFERVIYTHNLFPALIKHKKTAPISMFLTKGINSLDFINTFKELTDFDILELLTPEQKYRIIEFDKYISFLAGTNKDHFIYWYNGKAKEYFHKNDRKNDMILFEYLNIIARGIENDFFNELRQ